jgi:ribosomal protein S18 acetylase RimI-like enzyme
MTLAEDWAQEHNLTSTGLNVAAHNGGPISLYENLGYQARTLRFPRILKDIEAR